MDSGEKEKMMQFVTFEGIDGSGKSTVSKLVCEKLQKNGYKTLLTFEPTDSWIGKKVQRCIQTRTDPFVTAFTFIADRIEHCKKIKSWMDDGYIVLCDRYAESTYAYQGAQMQGLIDDPIKYLKDLSKNMILFPDRTYLFVISPKDSLARIQNRKDLIDFEKVDFLEKVEENYFKISVGKKFMKIDATRTIDELVDICFDDIINSK
jgi:dTMP kinase